MKIYHVFKYGYEGRWGNTYALTEEVARVQFEALKLAVLKEALEMLHISEGEYKDSEYIYNSRDADHIKGEKADIEILKSLTFDNCKDRSNQPKWLESLKWELIDVVEK